MRFKRNRHQQSTYVPNDIRENDKVIVKIQRWNVCPTM